MNRKISLLLIALPISTWAQDAASTDNPYGLASLLAHGDLVARLTLALLVLMSLGSWYVIASKLLEQLQIQRRARQITDTFWNQPSLHASCNTLNPDSPYRYVLVSALDGVSRHRGLLDAMDFNTWITLTIQRALGRVQASLQSGITLLATVGSIAPFVGLFGTVWGIYNALVGIGLSGQASIDRVAGPVGESLIMTALGLAVAVPAVLGYNILVRRNKVLIDDMQSFGADLHAVLLARPGA